ncbi:hypothetical protein DXM27_07325 [Rhizobium rhizogenes]|uniref:site-specific DNA-methyltransferase (adenine-specific) n=2 Tax=Rhizobium rhizogenes TaxID=359 RepID=A0AA88F1P2_RHIRH|nr:hypothetical protein DXM27_07325 [Rhizobium rhizogenes]
MNGVVYTPLSVAYSVAKFSLDQSPSTRTVIEPSCGDGAFVKALRQLEGGEKLAITAVDIDASALELVAANDREILAQNEDYLSFSRNTDASYDLVIGNPPYVRRHNFTKALKDSIKDLSVRTEYPEAQLKNAWVAFVVASCELMSSDGSLAFIVPYELVTVSYGKYLRQWLISKHRRVDIFIPRQKAFRDIDQDAVFLLVSNSRKRNSGSYLHSVDGLDALGMETDSVPASISFDPIIEKSYLLDGQDIEIIEKIRKSTGSIGDYCSSSAGTVTAANDYFILSGSDVEKYGLRAWARPILKKGAYVKSLPIFSDEDFEKLAAVEPCFLIDFCRKGAPPLDSHAFSYIEAGEKAGFNTRYKTRHRSPWYRVPVVPETGALFFKRSHKLPKFCLNHAGVLATDTAYQVKAKADFSVEAICFSFYNSLTALFCEIEGRFYGGGVLELTPVEFRGLPLEYTSPSTAQFKDFCSIAARSGDLLSFGDMWLRQKLNLSDAEMLTIRNALDVLQKHRLRHGKSLS